MIQRDAATEAQVQAAHPDRSTWLAANAGSGKTRVLTDRVARLLFTGVEPQNILCLTYTKAAASEMQNRLFRRLGEWAMMPPGDLARQLRHLGAEGDLGAAHLRRARTLFARAIETPGGLRIQTIHSFCAGLLRRFPLEAGVSPQFAEMEDRAAELLREAITEAISKDRPHLMADLAAHMTGDDFQPLLKAVAENRDQFARPVEEDALRRALGLGPQDNRDTALARAFRGDEAGIVADLGAVFADQAATYQDFARTLAGLDLVRPGWAELETVLDLFLYKSNDSKHGAYRKDDSKSRNFPPSAHSKAVAAMAPIAEAVHDWMDRVAAARDLLKSLDTLDRTLALHAFATEFARRYEAEKLARGVLDYDDLILKARALLTDPRVAQWVLFRLDGGIDHILVDEAQDTSPAQWDVIRSLAQEFTAGIGARSDRQRTIFVVGDKKQSIYSFQGADPEGFDRMRDHFDTALGAIGAPLRSLVLQHSFRSASEILRVVDLTFQREALEGLGPDPLDHRAFHAALPGRVDLWPPIIQPEKPDDLHWTEPVDQVSDQHAYVQLARSIAAQIRQMITSETLPVVRPDGTVARRAITAGDILILVRGRGKDSKVSLFEEIIAACKGAGLDVAGADVVQLGSELAVKDILALLRFLALPEDDLSLAAALRSPLLGWTEQELYALAQPRGPAYLWQALRDAENRPDTAAILDDLRDRADFMRPYDLISRILIRHDGRRRLIARLGPDCEDAIDALLAQALAYERSEIPSLTGFVEWLGAGELEIKRQVAARADKIRVMTVHGAKGLEAPIVILPDTATRSDPVRARIYPVADQAIWPPAADEMPEPVRAVRDRIKETEQREGRRLLYVAMTRAESWLIVCAAGEVGSGLQSWHATVQAGLDQAGAVPCDFPTGTGLRHATRDWDAGVRLESLGPVVETVSVLPELAPVVAGPGPGGVRTPSDLGGEKALPGEHDGDDIDDALARGTLIHLLLEHLPLHPPEARHAVGQAILAAAPEALGLPDAADLLTDAVGLVGKAELAPIFAPDALTEVDLTAALPTGRMRGTIDRLLLTDGRVLAIDYKSNRVVAATPEATPEGLLRQMGAYHAMLRQIWPDRQVDVAILWTATATLMPLPEPLITAALNRAPDA